MAVSAVLGARFSAGSGTGVPPTAAMVERRNWTCCTSSVIKVAAMLAIALYLKVIFAPPVTAPAPVPISAADSPDPVTTYE